jgi:hypothetical protein
VANRRLDIGDLCSSAQTDGQPGINLQSGREAARGKYCLDGLDDSIYKESKMAVTQSCMDFINGINVFADRLQYGETETRTPSSQGRRKQGISYHEHAGISGPRVVPPLTSVGAGRLRFGSRGADHGAEHTHSNLG